MKKVLSLVLVLAMVVCFIPAFASSAEAYQYIGDAGVNAKLYQYHWRSFSDIIAYDGDERGASVSFEHNTKYDASITELMAASMLIKEESGLTGFGKRMTDDSAASKLYTGADNFLTEWNGTITATETGAYKFVGRKIDNGCTIFVNNVKVFEYWGAGHWFDGANDALVSDVAFNLTAGSAAQIKIVYLELDGGEALEFNIKKDDGENKSFADAGISFALSAKYYTNKNYNTIIGPGTSANGAQCVPENQLYDESVDDLIAASNLVKEGTLSTIRPETMTGDEGWKSELTGDENYMYIMDGYLTVDKTGYYLFGVWKIDNGFYMNINGTVVFELWAGFTWNDNASQAWSSTPIYLEAGTAYPYNAAFLETNGGQCFFADVKYSATREGASTSAQKAMFLGGISFFTTSSVTAVPNVINVTTPDELVTAMTNVNKLTKAATKSITINIMNDLDMTGKTWVPLNIFVGTFNGNGKTISNIEYSTTATAGDFGLIANTLANDNANGTVKDVVISNSTISAQHTNGSVGAIAGLSDRGRITGCTVSGVTVNGSGITGGIAGRAEWQSDGENILVRDCSVIGSDIFASGYAGGVVGTANTSAIVALGDVTVTDTSVFAYTAEPLVGHSNVPYSAGLVALNGTVVNSTIEPPPATMNAFSYQTRAGAAEGTTDYRIIATSNEEWIKAKEDLSIEITFTNGTEGEEKSIIVVPAKAYTAIEATGNGYTNIYTTSPESVIYGWIVTGVPSGYTIDGAAFIN